MDYYEQFGLARMFSDEMRTVYGEAGQWLIIVFHLFSGVDAVLYNQFARFERAPGEIQLDDTRFYCISYYTMGMGESDLGNHRRREALPGIIDVLRDHPVSAQTAVRAEGVHGYNVMLFPEQLQPELSEMLVHNFDVSLSDIMALLDEAAIAASFIPNERLLHIAGELGDYLQDEAIGMVRLKVLEFFYAISTGGLKFISSTKHCSPTHIEKTMRIHDRMLTDLSRHKTITALCRDEGLSETAFKDCFKALYQRTPADFLRTARMNQAAIFLADSNCSIAEIARMMGYDNPSNFTRTFRAVYGMLPKDYREKCLK